MFSTLALCLATLLLYYYFQMEEICLQKCEMAEVKRPSKISEVKKAKTKGKCSRKDTDLRRT